MENMNIFQRMAKITAELAPVAKNLIVQQTKTSSYKAVAERDIIDAVKPFEEKYGVYSYPADRKIIESHVLESESEYNGKVTRKTTFMTRMETVYRFVNIDNPEDYMETTVFSEGIDTQDKGSGKGMTYGDKYALMKCYKISTGEDPDQEASKDEGYRKTVNAKKGSLSSYQLETISQYPEKTLQWVKDRYGVKNVADLSMEQATEIIYQAKEAQKAREAMANG